jgi:iron complex outermembrane recepter protein
MLSALIAGALLQTFVSQSAGAAATPESLKRLSLEELLDLEVTSVSRRPQKLTATASAIQVIRSEDIRRSAATQLPDVLRLASNLEVARVGARSWAISARGFDIPLANKLLVLMDGRNVYSPLFHGVLWDAQDTVLADIDRIEVISGPGATQWGANAVNGVVNITTKRAADTHGLLFEAGGGNRLPAFGTARYGGAVTPDLNFRVYAKYHDRDASVGTSGQDLNDDWHSRHGGFRMDWDATPQQLLTLQGDVHELQFDDNNPANTQRQRGHNLILRWSQSLSEDSQLQAQMYYDRAERATTTLVDTLDSYDVDVQHNFALGARQHVIWGFGYRRSHDDVDSAQLVLDPSETSQEWLSGFVEDELTLAPEKLFLTAGVKIERNDYTGWEYQPSVRLAWQVDPSILLWTALSRAVRTPSRLDSDLVLGAFDGGRNFESEELLAYEVGARWQPSERIAISLATYYNDYDKLRSVELRANPPPPQFVIENLHYGEAYGAELTVGVQMLERWRLFAGYTYLNLDIRARPGSFDTTAGGSEAADPDYQALLRSSLDLAPNVTFDAVLRYVDRIDIQRVPAYAELDARLGWQISPQIELVLAGENLLHDRHAEFNLPATRQELERSVYGKVVCSF